MPRGVDFNITSYQRLIQKIEYCHKNPVKRLLVSRPEDWPWSSFNHFNRSGTVMMNLDWNGSWPLD
jgi:putative transposase